MAQIPKLMARLQFGLQFNTVPRRPGQAGQGRWSSLNRSGQRRPELLMRHTSRKFRAKRRPEAQGMRSACDSGWHSKPRSRTGSCGHPTVAGMKVLGKHLRWQFSEGYARDERGSGGQSRYVCRGLA